MILRIIIPVDILECGCKMSEVIKVSALGKTWLMDIDGTICKHNGYRIDGYDTLLPGAREFFEQLPSADKVIFITSRKIDVAKQTEEFLKKSGIRYDEIIYELPYGERILINDRKPSGLKTSIAINTERDHFMEQIFKVDDSL